MKITESDRKEARKRARKNLRTVSKELQLSIEGAAMAAIQLLTPHRASITGSTVDNALDQLRSILNVADELQYALRQTRRLLKER